MKRRRQKTWMCENIGQFRRLKEWACSWAGMELRNRSSAHFVRGRAVSHSKIVEPTNLLAREIAVQQVSVLLKRKTHYRKGNR